jgi:hypothetical protein
MSEQSKFSPEKLGVMTPFEETAHPPAHSPHTSRSAIYWALAGALAMALVVGAGVVAVMIWRSAVENPYRTLEVFSPDKYFDNPRALIGNRFQATLRIEGDLGWSDGIGKLMVMSAENDSRYLPVLVDEDSLTYTFSKGQQFVAQISIREGGLLYATDLRKK